MSDKRAVTMDDIARLAMVSKPTVSRALNNSPLVKEKTRNRVLAVAHEHGYAVNRNAQKLRRKRTNTIAVSLDFGSQFLRIAVDRVAVLFGENLAISSGLIVVNAKLACCRSTPPPPGVPIVIISSMTSSSLPS